MVEQIVNSKHVIHESLGNGYKRIITYELITTIDNEGFYIIEHKTEWKKVSEVITQEDSHVFGR